MRFLRELFGVLLDLAAQLIVLRLPVFRVDRDEEREQTGALDVPQELQPESLALVRALDDAGNVGHVR
jgi:hypothetical protein